MQNGANGCGKSGKATAEFNGTEEVLSRAFLPAATSHSRIYFRDARPCCKPQQ